MQDGFDIIAQADDAQSGYRVLARKYRPRKFSDLIGQEAMVQTLRNAFETGRIAHAFILTGVRGVGKTTTARILARALNYSPTESGAKDAPSLEMEVLGQHCADIMAGNHVDVVEMDAASHTGINDIREIIENIRYAPTQARYKIFIIDEVHMLSRSAFNGLLKTLEEPPPYAKFIFATTEIRAVPITVLSRCQRFDLRRLSLDEIMLLQSRVCEQEQVKLETETCAVIARAADGSARDALSLLDRAFAYGGEDMAALDAATMREILGMANRERLFDLFETLLRGDVAAALEEFSEHYNLGTEPATIIADLSELTYFLTRIKFVADAGDDVTFSEAVRARAKEAAAKLPTRILTRAWQVLSQGYDEVRFSAHARAAAEMVLIRLAHLTTAPTPEELVANYEAAAKTQSQPQTQTSTPTQATQPQTSGATALKTEIATAPTTAPTALKQPSHLKAVASSPAIATPTPALAPTPEPNPEPTQAQDPKIAAALKAFPGARIVAETPPVDMPEAGEQEEE